MKNSILSLEGVEVLSKKQMKNVGGGLAEASLGGEKCEGISTIHTPYMVDGQPISQCTITYRCRPSILGIGVGSWGDVQTGLHVLICSIKTFTLLN
jgi:hypothetical protein